MYEIYERMECSIIYTGHLFVFNFEPYKVFICVQS